MAGYVKRLPYAEKLVVEIFGEYIFPRDITPAGYKMTNACQLAIPPICRSAFLKLILPMGKRDYGRLMNWLFSDHAKLKVNQVNISKFDRFTEEHIVGIISEYQPTGNEMKEFLAAADHYQKVIVPGFTEDETRVAMLLAKLDGSLSDSQIQWLHGFQFKPKSKSLQLKLPE